MKEFFKKLWEKVKTWAVKTAWPWIKKSWVQVVNVLVVLYAYGKLDDAATAFKTLGDIQSEKMVALASALVGLWAFILLVYWFVWKLLGFDKVFYGWLEERKRKKQTPK